MSLLDVLAARLPVAIPVDAHDIRVLVDPHEFYATLIRIIRTATRRVCLSSLYIGPSEHELLAVLDTALRENTRLHLHLVLDYNRSTRPGPDSPLLALVPLLRSYPSRVHLSLFRSPNLSSPVSSLVPPRFNEGWGTWHPKIYSADDNVIITGANLNTSYFTNRQDRYILFRSQPILADYCSSFLRLISASAYNVSASHTDTPIIRWPDTSTPPWKIHSKVYRALSQFHHPARRPSSHLTSDTVLFPLIQGGQFNIREEERTLSILFDYLASNHLNRPSTPLVSWTSGYFGLYKPYQRLILGSPAACDVIAAGPKANGFYGSRGLSGLIPEGYTLLEQRFMRAVRAAHRLPDHCNNPVTLLEWERQNWTYHAKGIWLSPSRDRPPMLTMFGSTNLNSRSANLDTELSFVMVTSSQTLQQTLHDELHNLRRWAIPWRGADRRVRWRTKAIVGLVGRML